MPRITKVYTRTGDDGTTALGGGSRVGKDSPRIAAYGTVDELNSQIGLALASGVNDDITASLRSIQNDLFHLGSDLCVPEEEKERRPVPSIEERHVAALESLMDRLSEELPPLENFILPGGAPGAAQLHVARTICRRAERHVVSLAAEVEVDPVVLAYLNRLSDFLFVAARVANHRARREEPLWDPARGR